MRRALVCAVALVLAAQWPVSAKADWCAQHDGHGRCLACFFSFDLILKPGEIAHPVSCGDMAHDPRAMVWIGGVGTYLGDAGSAAKLDHRIGLRIGGRYSVRRIWGPNTATMPIGPIVVPLGPVVNGGTIEPRLQLIECRSSHGGTSDCDFSLRGKICVTGTC